MSDELEHLRKVVSELQAELAKHDLAYRSLLSQVATLRPDARAQALRVSLQRECDKRRRVSEKLTAFHKISREQLVRISEERDRYRTALEHIATMPEYDQDDAHRLRDKAQHALDNIEPRPKTDGPVGAGGLGPEVLDWPDRNRLIGNLADRYECPTCKSKGFQPSVLVNRCTFCDGTEGGNPPTGDE